MPFLKNMIKPRKYTFSGVSYFLSPLIATIFLTLVFTPPKLLAQPTISYNNEIEETYFLILDLKMKQAEKNLVKIKENDPHNLAILHLESLKDFLEIFINEEENKFSSVRSAYEARVKLLKKTTVKSPYKNYITAESHLHWGLLNLKFGNFYRAFVSIKKAYHLYESNVKEYPDFLPNYKSLGILHSAISIVPPEYMWGLKLLTGMEGDLDQGQKEIEHVLENTDPDSFIFYRETLAMYIMLQLYINNNPDKAWKLIKDLNVDPTTEPLTCFAFANLAMRTSHNDTAIEYLENRPTDAEYMPFPYLDFMLGEAYLRKLDNRADIHLKKFLQTYPGHNYIKEAYQKLAWHGIIFGTEKEYNDALDMALKKGTTLIDADKNAEKEARNRKVPQIALLKAQLLFDGGYYSQAYSLLLNNSDALYTSEEYTYEYIYRMARVLHKMKKQEEAQAYYLMTFERGVNRAEYYACNAALQLGIMAEESGKTENARKWYGKCLELNPAEYATGLHRDAKAGLERLNKQ